MFNFHRFEELRVEQGITKKAIADAIGRTSTVVQDWKAGKSEPNDEQIHVVARLLHTTAEYLRGESDEAHTSENNADLLEELQILRDRPDIRAMLHVNKRMTPEQVRKFIDMIRAMQEEP